MKIFRNKNGSFVVFHMNLVGFFLSFKFFHKISFYIPYLKRSTNVYEHHPLPDINVTWNRGCKAYRVDQNGGTSSSSKLQKSVFEWYFWTKEGSIKRWRINQGSISKFFEWMPICSSSWNRCKSIISYFLANLENASSSTSDNVGSQLMSMWSLKILIS